VVVIGSGAGGGTVAKVLADLGVSVLLLEAGPVFNPAKDIKEHMCWLRRRTYVACRSATVSGVSGNGRSQGAIRLLDDRAVVASYRGAETELPSHRATRE
jgi:choline dehydrogenase-like flavoprotein